MKNYYNNLTINEDKIIFEDIFDEPINDYINILKSRNIVVFGTYFNHSLCLLPENIEEIYLGKYYTTTLFDIPINVKSIIFANDSQYYHDIKNFHDNLEKLILGDDYDCIIDKLPKNLKILILGKDYKHKIINFPDNLVYLDIGENYNNDLDNLPLSLETLIISGNFNNYIKYPPKLKNFIINQNCIFNQPLDGLPDSLIYFSIQNKYYLPIDKLPFSILYLSLGDYYNGYIINFPKKLKKIKLSKNFNYDFTILPENLEIIQLYRCYKYLNFLLYKFSNIELEFIDTI